MFDFIKRITKAIFRRVTCLISCCLPINGKKIVVSSYYGRGYGDNPKYIVEKLLENKSRCQIIWLVYNKTEAVSLPEKVIPCKRNSFSAIYHLCTSKVWLDNCRRTFMIKRKKQFYIQTWHGMALKRIERDVEENLSKSYVKTAKKDSKAIDIIISESKYMTEIYQKSFWYNGDIVEWGSPRNDIIVNHHKVNYLKNKICDYYNQPLETKFVLYAPTFRKSKDLEPYSVDFARLKQQCDKKFGGNFIVLLRLHPNIADKSDEMNVNDKFVLNASFYPDMQELLAVSDVVISDYSSLMFDFALSGKPCFQFATDIENYKLDRNFYLEMDKLPFDLATNNDELEKNIDNFNHSKYQNKLSTFFDNLGAVRDGKSSEKCAELIENLIN